MHECLEVFDIVKLIFEAVRDNPSRIASQTLLSLAVTCHVFHDVALDTLWFEQTSLVPLLKVLPCSFWKENPKVGLYRTFVSVQSPLFVEVLTLSFQTWSTSLFKRLDFTRFDSYAQWIRFLDYAPYNLCCLAYLARRRGHDHSFFLNLRRLWFTVPGYLEQCPRVFLQHSSISLSLDWNEGDEDVFKVFPCIENYVPELEGLDLGSYILDCSAACVKNCRLLSAFVCKMNNLTWLACGSLALSDSALLHLASLPHLQFLQTPNTVDDIVRSIKAHRDGDLEQPFPSLQ